MRSIFSLIILFSSLVTQAKFCPEIVDRSDNGRMIYQKQCLEDLESLTSFQGKYFIIVRGRDSQAISFNEDPMLVLRAATVYYHLTKARNFFINTLKSTFVSSLPLTIIRIEHTNQFSPLALFMNDQLDPQFNNALTIPPGKGIPRRGIPGWEREIWFRPAKKIHLNELEAPRGELRASLRGPKNQIHGQNLKIFLAQSLALAVRGNPLTLDQLFVSGQTSVLLELFYLGADPLEYLLRRKIYFLDSALVPEIIYHEYAHLALSDTMEVTHSGPVNEGMADFFAALIADSPKLAARINKFNRFQAKNGKKQRGFRLKFEQAQFSNTDFTFSVLWQIFQETGLPLDYFYHLRFYLNTSADLRYDFTHGLVKTCDKMNLNQLGCRAKILSILNQRGF